MFVILSPAKSLDYTSSLPNQLASLPNTIPSFLTESSELVDICRQFAPEELSSLMKVSDKIAALNVARYIDWSDDFNEGEKRQAILAFTGDVYTGFDVTSLDQATLEYAQQHLGILSGLYGLLKPLDLMKPYRLEMGTKLETKRGKNLYEFWGNKITQMLEQRMAESENNYLINLASNEYSKSVKLNQLHTPVITPIFKDFKSGKYKIVSFYAKKARGLMTRYIMQNKLTHPDQLKDFEEAGYYYVASESTDSNFVFHRDEVL